MPRILQRKKPKLGPSDSSDTASDRPSEPDTDSDSGATGERAHPGLDPDGELHDELHPDRVVEGDEAGLGGGLDEAEEARARKRKR